MNLVELVSEFAAGHVGETVTSAQLYNFISSRAECSPGSEARVLRGLRLKGIISYHVPNRKRGEYHITAVH